MSSSPIHRTFDHSAGGENPGALKRFGVSTILADPRFQALPRLSKALGRLKGVERRFITGGEPYANGNLHLGHLAGALFAPDAYARWSRLVFGRENVAFITGSDDYGTAPELKAMAAGMPVAEYVRGIHDGHVATLRTYSIAPEVYGGSSHPEFSAMHHEFMLGLFRKLHEKGFLKPHEGRQWFDPKLNKYLVDRFVRGECPSCADTDAFSDECEACNSQYDPEHLKNPRSEWSDARPELRQSFSWELDMPRVRAGLLSWIRSNEGSWRTQIINDALVRLVPSLFVKPDVAPTEKNPNVRKAAKDALLARIEGMRASLPPFTFKGAELQFERDEDLASAKEVLTAQGIKWVPNKSIITPRDITRDLSWGIPLPVDLDPRMAAKSLYCWWESLGAQWSYLLAALKGDRVAFDRFVRDPATQIIQFTGEGTIYFYTIMWPATLLALVDDPSGQPQAGDLRLPTEIVPVKHMLAGGVKMSKRTGNNVPLDDLVKPEFTVQVAVLDDKGKVIMEKGKDGEKKPRMVEKTFRGFSADQIRLFVAGMNLTDTNADFDASRVAQKTRLFALTLNNLAMKALRPVHEKYGGKVPDGEIAPEVSAAIREAVDQYGAALEEKNFPGAVNAIEALIHVGTKYRKETNAFSSDQDPAVRGQSLRNLLEIVRVISILLEPIASEASANLRDKLGLSDEKDLNLAGLLDPLPVGHPLGPFVHYDFFPGVLIEGQTEE